MREYPLDCVRFSYPIELVQDTEDIEDQPFLRRMFVYKSTDTATTSNLDGQQQQQPQQSNYTYSLLDNDNIFGNKFRPLKVTTNSNSATGLNKNEQIVLRIKSGLSGYTEWMNEMQVYLLPNFKHKNILEPFGCANDELSRMPPIKEVRKNLDQLNSQIDNNSRPSKGTGASNQPNEQRADDDQDDGDFEFISHIKPMQIEYWLANKFQDCVLLKDHLKQNSITWKQLLQISMGIADGLHYLHEHSEYLPNEIKSGSIDGFVRSTRGAIKKVAFECRKSILYLKPYYNLSVIHRNLSTSSIVIRIKRGSGSSDQDNLDDSVLQPLIWNFNMAHIYQPFQPTNLVQYLPIELKQALSLSAHSAPEVLLGKSSSLTLHAMKSVDIYALAVIYWELMTRCKLPKLDRANQLEHKQRNEPKPYREPFEIEFNSCFDDIRAAGNEPKDNKQVLVDLLEDSVAYKKCRPTIKNYWLIGRKTQMFVQMIMDLWDENWEARLHVTTVMDRLNHLYNLNLYKDERITRPSKQFGSKIYNYDRYWPIKKFSTQAPVRPERAQACIRFLASGD